VIFNPNGARLATPSLDHDGVRIWDGTPLPD
jgi:hypothetical protein